MTTWLVDVHPQFQAGLNVPHLAVEGYSAVVVKATQGTTWRSDATLERWIGQAEDAGMIAGFYHWINNADPVAQVNNFLNRVSPLGGVANRLVQLDCEDNASLDVITRWLAEFRRRTNDHPVLLYTGAWWWAAAGRGWNGAALTPYLWNSRYVGGSGYASSLYAKMPSSWWTPNYGGWPASTITQFSAQGTAGGLTANVDVDAFLGTREQLWSLTGATPIIVEDGMAGTLAERLIEALNLGSDTTTEGEHCELTTRQRRLDTHIDGTRDTLARIEAAQGQPAPVNIPDAQLQQLFQQLAVDVANLLAPQFKDVADIKKALGDWADAQATGDAALGKLNDA